MYNKGISYIGDVLNLGLKYGVVNKGGSWFNYGDMKLGQGTEGTKKFFEENPKVFKEIINKIIEAAEKESKEVYE